jgi:hypothetical protein
MKNIFELYFGLEKESTWVGTNTTAKTTIATCGTATTTTTASSARNDLSNKAAAFMMIILILFCLFLLLRGFLQYLKNSFSK